MGKDGGFLQHFPLSRLLRRQGAAFWKNGQAKVEGKGQRLAGDCSEKNKDPGSVYTSWVLIFLGTIACQPLPFPFNFRLTVFPERRPLPPKKTGQGKMLEKAPIFPHAPSDSLFFLRWV